MYRRDTRLTILVKVLLGNRPVRLLGNLAEDLRIIL